MDRARINRRDLLVGTIAAVARFDREVAPDVVWKPGEQVAKRAVLTGLRRKSRTELRLAAGAPQKHNHDL